MANWVRWLVGIIATVMVAAVASLASQDRELEQQITENRVRIAAIEERQQQQFDRLLAAVERIEKKVDAASEERSRLLERYGYLLKP